MHYLLWEKYRWWYPIIHEWDFYGRLFLKIHIRFRVDSLLSTLCRNRARNAFKLSLTVSTPHMTSVLSIKNIRERGRDIHDRLAVDIPIVDCATRSRSDFLGIWIEWYVMNQLSHNHSPEYFLVNFQLSFCLKPVGNEPLELQCISMGSLIEFEFQNMKEVCPVWVPHVCPPGIPWICITDQLERIRGLL